MARKHRVSIVPTISVHCGIITSFVRSNYLLDGEEISTNGPSLGATCCLGGRHKGARCRVVGKSISLISICIYCIDDTTTWKCVLCCLIRSHEGRFGRCKPKVQKHCQYSKIQNGEGLLRSFRGGQRNI